MNIINAVFLSPRLSVRYMSAGAGWLQAWVNSRLDQGVVVFLSVLDQTETINARTWHRSIAAEVRYGKLRLITPGSLLWSGDAVPLPVGSAWTEDRIALLHSDLGPAVGQVVSGALIETKPGDDNLSLNSPGMLSKDQIEELWRLGSRRAVLLATDPGNSEPFQDATGRWSSILAPAVPSEVWANAVVRAEGISPDNLLVFRAATEGAHLSLQAFADALKEEMAGANVLPFVEVSDEESDIGIREDCKFAPRINAPSSIHFVERWTETNQEYVRRHYWAATQQARANASEGIELLAGLDRSRFKRVDDLLASASKDGGQRLFDDYCGAVCFDPGFYEFELSASSGDHYVDQLTATVKAYFDEKIEDMPFDRPLLRRRMFTNSLVLLRGEGYYSNLKELPPWKRASDFAYEATKLEALFRSIANNGQLLKAMVSSIHGVEKTANAWKLLLGAFDQARNLGLAMLSVAAYRWGDQGAETDDPLLLRQASFLIRSYYGVMLGDMRLDVTLARSMSEALIKAKAEMRELAKAEGARAKESDWYEPGKAIRGWREADNPFENFLTSLLALQGRVNGSEGLAVLGMFWGAVELPLAASVAADATGVDLSSWGFARYSRYSSTAEKQDGYYCDLKEHKWRSVVDIPKNGAGRLLLMDDNSLTGQTLETARDMLFRAGVEEVETWIVRFSGERREGQMRMKNGGIVEPSYLIHRLRGYLGETPYARSYSRKHYESPVGVFDTARARILRYLHNNGFASIFEREGF